MKTKINSIIDNLLLPACRISKEQIILYANAEFYSMVKASKSSQKTGIPLKRYLTVNPINGKASLKLKIKSSKTVISLHHVEAITARGATLSISINLLHGALFIPGDSSRILLCTDFSEKKTDYKTLLNKEKKETRRLSKSNNELRELMAQKTTELKKAYDEFNHELEIARNVQDGLLPKELPNLISMRTASAYIPTGKVGGDLFDILITKERKIAVLIFDVSGHGVPAALIAAMAKMLFTYYIEREDSPAAIFSEINQRLSSYIQTGHYITAFLGFLDPSDNTMIYSRAGHSRPIVYHSQSKKISFLRGDSIFIGHPALLDIAVYRNDTLKLHWNDKLLLYTDGIIESINAQGEMYTQEALSEVIKTNSESDPVSLIQNIITDNKKFRNDCNLEDDVSLLCIQIGCDESVLKESGFSASDSPGVLSFNSHEEIEGICSIILRELDKKGYPTQHFFQAHLCIHEILSNAIRHGNRYDIDKKAIVMYKVTLEKFAISVIDEGEGFDYNSLPNPLEFENLTKDHGRGLFLVKNYMDEVKFNKKGNRILAVKRLKQE